MLQVLAVVLLATVPFTGFVDLRVDSPAVSGSVEWWAVDALSPGISPRVQFTPIEKDGKTVRVTWIGNLDYHSPVDVDVYVRVMQPGQTFPAEAVGRVRFAPTGWTTPVIRVVPTPRFGK